MRNLSDARTGETVMVKRVGGEGQIKSRITDMGITEGGYVHVLRFAPLGDPMEIETRGYTLAIRKKDAKLIEII